MCFKLFDVVNILYSFTAFVCVHICLRKVLSDKKNARNMNLGCYFTFSLLSC